MKNYIGLATSPHDPSISIVNSSGELVYAESTERLLQTKRAWGINPDQINHISGIIEKYCDPTLDTVIASTWTKKMAKRYKLLLPLLNYRIKNSKRVNRVSALSLKHLGYAHLSTMELAGTATEYALADTQSKISSEYYDHHLTHAAMSAFGSSFDSALCVVIDGFGEKSSVAAFDYEDGKLRRLKGVRSKIASFGFFYSNLCRICGFSPLHGEEWKLMGLAAYGDFDEKLYNVMRPILDVNSPLLRYGKSSPQCNKLLMDMVREQSVPAIEYANFAATAQYVFNEVIIEYLNNIYKICKKPNLVLGGGCALNSSTNGLILKNTQFEEMYVSSAPADDGNSIGAAYLAYYVDNPQEKPTKCVRSPYLGSEISKSALDRLCRFGSLNTKILEGDELYRFAAQALSKGKIIGWVQGKAEFGPRALGNRSIIADPRNKNVKDRINSEVKFREKFRPFAPSILHEFGDQYFENYQFSPYMERTLKFKEDVKHKVPGVVHEDGTGRLQSVTPEMNLHYYNLIRTFFEITGIPVLLNTSFNVMGKPIIHSVEDAIAVFNTSGLDILVIENKVFIKGEMTTEVFLGEKELNKKDEQNEGALA